MAVDNKEIEFSEEEIAYILSSISSAPADGYGQVSKNKAIHTTALRKLIAKMAQKFGVLLNETNDIGKTLNRLGDLLSEKQDQSDETLNTKSKKIAEAINELLGKNETVSATATEAKENANTALSNSSTALQTARTAVSTANSSLQQAKSYTDEQIANYGLYVVVSELPETGLPNKIYLVPTKNATENNVYDEYLWVNGAWEFQGSGKVDFDLSDYVKKVTSPSDTGRVYAIAPNGEQIVIGYSKDKTRGNIAQRKETGALATVMPINDEDCTPMAYVNNLPDNLTLTEDTYDESGWVTEGTKAKWQHWIGLGILVGKLEQEIGTVGHFYPIIPDTWNFSEVPVIPKLGVVYYDVQQGKFFRWGGKAFLESAGLLSEPVNVSIANFPDNVASDNNVWESRAKATWQNWLGIGDINTALETILGV